MISSQSVELIKLRFHTGPFWDEGTKCLQTFFCPCRINKVSRHTSILLKKLQNKLKKKTKRVWIGNATVTYHRPIYSKLKKAASNYINMTSRSQVKSRNQLSFPAGWLQNLKEHKDTDLHRLIRAFASGKQNHILAIAWYLGTVTKVPCILFNACTLCLLFPRCCAFSTAICLLFPHCYAMSTFFHAAVLYILFYASVSCLPFPHSYALSLFPCYCAMSTLVIPLRFIYLFHAVALSLLFPHCCVMSTFSTLLRHVYSFHQTALCLLFHQAAPCLHFPHCTVMSTFPTLLRHDYLFHVSFPMVLRVVYCGMSPFYALLCYVYFSLLLCHVYISTFLCYVSFYYTCMLSWQV